MSRRRISPAPAPPLDDEDLLQEILLQLAPRPSSLPRASLVCKLWRSILSDPEFLKRSRKHHRKPPLLGFFVGDYCGKNHVFALVLDLPDRIPSACFSVPDSCVFLRFTGYHHGLAVLVRPSRREIVVWDPLTGQQHLVNFPQGIYNDKWYSHSNATVLCADAEDGHVHGDCFLSPFKLVLLCDGYMRASACLYESTSGVWGNVVSVATTYAISMESPNILVGNAVCWLMCGGDVLVFDWERQSLAMIEKPADNHVTDYPCFQLLRTEDGGLDLAVLSKLTIKLWERKSNSDGVVRWVQVQKTIPLEVMFPRRMHSNDKRVHLVGYDEDRNVIVLSTMTGNFMLQLDSMQIRHIIKRNDMCYDTFYPYTNFYTAGRGVGWKWLDLKL